MQYKSRNSKLGSILLIVILLSSGLFIILQAMYDSNLASASTWTQTSDNDFDNGTFENILLNGTGDAAGLEIEISGISQWLDKTPSPRPAGYPNPKYGHEMATIATTDKVLMFSDKINSNNRNETWVYDLSDNNWTLKQPANNIHLMRYPKIASVFTDDKVVLFGGCGTSGKDNNETWLYDLSDNKWENKSLINPTPTNYPSTRFCQGLTSIWGTDQVILFGGRRQTDYYNDIWIYDVSANTWTEKKPAGVKPAPRANIEMTAIAGTDKVLMFSGNRTNETWIYDLSDNKWTEMERLPTDLTFPRIATIFGTDNVFLFGGFTSTWSNETWIFDWNGGPKGSWENITEITPLIPRYVHAMACVYNTKKVVLYGGAIGVSPWTGDDTWIFHFKSLTNNGTYVSEPYDTCSNSTFYSISWNADLPPTTTLQFQLRSANDKQNLTPKVFIGNDGTKSTFYTLSQSAIWEGHNGDRWIQYKVYFNSLNNSVTPSLKDVSINYNCRPNTIVLGPMNGSIISTNKPTFIWEFQDFDSTQQAAFQVLIDDDAGFQSVDFDSGVQSIGDEEWVFPNIIPDGQWFWKVRTQDTDTEWTEYSTPWIIKIDTHVPTSSVDIPTNNGFYNNLLKISGTAYDAPGGFDLYKVEITIKRINDNYYWIGTNWVPSISWVLTTGIAEWTYDTHTIPWTSGSHYSVQSRATDMAELVEVPESGKIFMIDTEYPISTINNPQENKWLNKVEIISGISTDFGGSGVEIVEILIKEAGTNEYWDGTQWNSRVHWLSVDGTKQWSYNASSVQWFTGNEYFLFSQAIDRAGNVELVASAKSFKYDAKVPEQLSILIDFDAEYTNTNSVILSIYGKDVGSGISDMSFSTDGSEWSAWEQFNLTTAFLFNPVDGEKTVYFRLRDYANNIAEPVFDQIVMDTTPPEQLGIIINGNSKYTNTNTVTLTLDAMDILSGVNEMSFSYDSMTWMDLEPFAAERILTIPAIDGESLIYFIVSDKAGNIAEPIFDSITLDVTPPEALSITIDGISVEAGSNRILLLLDAVDYLSGLNQMSISTDGKIWSAWEPFNHEKLFILDHIYNNQIIYFRVNDHAGNIGEPISTAISLNVTSEGPSETEGESNKESSSENPLGYIIIALAIVVVIILIIAFFSIFLKRKKYAEQKVLSNGAVTVKPRITSAQVLTTAGQVSSSPTLNPKLVQLPSTTTAAPTPSSKVPQLHEQPQVQAPSQMPSLQPAPQVTNAPFIPKLPPAKEAEEPSDENEPSVHLPDSEPSAEPSQ